MNIIDILDLCNRLRMLERVRNDRASHIKGDASYFLADEDLAIKQLKQEIEDKFGALIQEKIDNAMIEHCNSSFHQDYSV